MTPAEAARLYTEGRTTRQIAARAGVHESTIRHWLNGQGVKMRRRGAQPKAPVEDILTLRRRQKLSWEQIAAATAMSKTGVRRAYRQATGGDRGAVDHHRHLTTVQARRLTGLADRVPAQSHGSGRDRSSLEGRHLRDALVAHQRAGVTATELARHVGLSVTAVLHIIRDQTTRAT